MKKQLFTSILICCAVLTYAQEMPIDFSNNPADTFTAFDGSGFAFIGAPDNGANQVGQFFNDGSNANQGFYIDLASSVDLSTENTLTLRFYAFDPIGHRISLKLENGDEADLEVVQTTPKQSGWVDLEFDFVNTVGIYKRLTIFIDYGSTQTGTYLLDDINNGSTVTNPNEDDIVYDVLVWSDEFDSGTNSEIINNEKWFHQTQLPDGVSWFNGEEQHYTNKIENSHIKDGNLYIVAKKEIFTDQGQTKQYTSARLNSKFTFTYGRVDVRAKLPRGSGTWPAIWTLGKNVNEIGAYWQTQGFGTTNWPACGEIDIMEHGLGAVNHTSSAIHTPSSHGNTQNTASQEISDVANNYHIYSVNWSPNQITFLVDDVPFYTYKPSTKNTSTWPFNLEHYLILNIAMGGISGTIDPNFTESSMIIDYVRVYQNNDILSTSTFKNEVNIAVYPNPTSDFLHIKSTENINTISVYNLLGKNVIRRKINTHNYRLDVRNLPKGMYFLESNSNNRRRIVKILVK